MPKISTTKKVGIYSAQFHPYDALVIVAFCHYTLFDYLRVIISRIPIIAPISYFFFPIIYSVLIIMSISKNRFKWIRIEDFLILTFFTCSILASYAFYPINQQFINDRLTITILPSIPFFLLGLTIAIDERLLFKLGFWSCWAIAISTLYILYYMLTGRVLDGDEMAWAYSLLPNILIVLTCAMLKRRSIYPLFTLIGFIYLFAMGSRGPVVIFVVYFLIILYKQSKLSKPLVVAICVFSLLTLFVFMQTSIYISVLRLLERLFNQLGLSSRVFSYLISGEIISDTSGRLEIYQMLLEKLEMRPLQGFGVYGEWQFVNYSAHNIYIEAVFQYGWLVGIILIVSYLVVILFAYKKASFYARLWILLWASFTLIRGFFGGELLSYYVFFLLGYALRELRISHTYVHSNTRALSINSKLHI